MALYIEKRPYLQIILAAGLELPLSQVMMAFWPALGSSGSTEIVTMEGLNNTAIGTLVFKGSDVAELLASHL